MYENTPPPLPAAASRPGWGCLAKGCLTVVAVGVLLVLISGVIGWYTARDLMPFLSQQPVSIRVFPATDAQYQEIGNRLGTFVQAVNAGHAGTLSLSADDINILIARDPRFAKLRGKAYLAIANDEVSTDTCVLLNQDAPDSQKVYLHGRVVVNASFASNHFTLVLRRVEPPGGGVTPPILAWFIKQENSSLDLTHLVNESFRDNLAQTPDASTFFQRVRTLVVSDNQIVVTALEAPGTVATPADSP